MNHDLSDMRVLDLTQMMAGPLCTMMLADMGADVVKIEPPEGETSRAMGDTFVGGESDFFLALNRNKRSVVLDLKTREGLEAFKALAAHADVVVENFRPGTAERLGIGYETLKAINPALVYCAVAGFRSDSSNRDRPATDPIVQALTGIMYLTGSQSSGPMKTGFPLGDYVAPLMATIGILSALHYVRATGVGQRVDVSMFDATLFSMMPRQAYYFCRGESPDLLGNSHPQVVPGNTYATSDGRQIMLFAHTDKFWRALVAALGSAELAVDERYGTNAQRVARRAEVDGLIQAVFATNTCAHWMEHLTKSGVMFAPVRGIAEVLEDPEVRKDMVVELDHPKAGKVAVFGNPIRMSESPMTVRTAPPLLGQHTEEVLREWRRR